MDPKGLNSTYYAIRSSHSKVQNEIIYRNYIKSIEFEDRNKNRIDPQVDRARNHFTLLLDALPACPRGTNHQKMNKSDFQLNKETTIGTEKYIPLVYHVRKVA